MIGGAIMIKRNVWAEIDLAAIKNNVAVTREVLEPDVRLCAVVKANAYGHGAVEVAKAALEAGASYLAVAMTQEALELREAGITAPVLILGAVTPGHEEALVENTITSAVFTLGMAQALSHAAVKLNKIAKVHLAIDTGMTRIGCDPNQAGKLAQAIQQLPNMELEGMFSHFATADELDKTYSRLQIYRFTEAVQSVKASGVDIPLLHLDNSAGLTELPECHYNMVRQGITLYGCWPSDEVEKCLNIKPVMTLKAKLVYVKNVAIGEKIGYGGTFTTKRFTKLATLPLGYADGISRKLSNKGYVLIRGHKAPIVGRVCMDQFMVDVTDVPDVKGGDEAIIWGGNGPSLEQVAEWMETINYEVSCLLTSRVPRVYVQ